MKLVWTAYLLGTLFLALILSLDVQPAPRVVQWSKCQEQWESQEVAPHLACSHGLYEAFDGPIP